MLHLAPGYIPEPYAQVVTLHNPSRISGAERGWGGGTVDLCADVNCWCPVTYSGRQEGNLLVHLLVYLTQASTAGFFGRRCGRK